MFPVHCNACRRGESLHRDVISIILACRVSCQQGEQLNAASVLHGRNINSEGVTPALVRDDKRAALPEEYHFESSNPASAPFTETEWVCVRFTGRVRCRLGGGHFLLLVVPYRWNVDPEYNTISERYGARR